MLVDTLHGATVVPSAAIQRGAPGTFVYLIKPDNTVAVQKVTLGPSDDNAVAVTQGLSPGDQVVVDGADKLRDGASVAISRADGAVSPGNSAQQGQTPQRKGEKRRRSSQ